MDESRIVCHKIADDAYPIDIWGIKSYGSRGALVAEKDDVLVLPKALEHFVPHMRACLMRAGLDLPRYVDCADEMETLGASAYQGMPVSVFRWTPSIAQRCDDRGQLEVVETVDDKNWLIETARTVIGDFAVPHTTTYERRCLVHPELVGTPIVLKVARNSASGVGVTKCNDRVALGEALVSIPAEAPVQLQKLLPPNTIWASAQYRTGGGKFQRSGATVNAFVDGTVHDGNDSLADDDMQWGLPDAMAKHCVEDLGYDLESLAFDVALLPDGRALLIEGGPRATAPFYPLTLARRIKKAGGPDLGGSWRLRNVMLDGRFGPADVDTLFGKVDDLMFDLESGEGVMIDNWCVDEQDRLGKLGAIFYARTHARRVAMHRDFVHRVGDQATIDSLQAA